MQLSYGGTIAGSYGYFPDGRLATSTLGGTSASYLFDVAGNLISDTEGSSTTTFDYNQDTNELSTSETGSNTNYYSYDANNGWRTSQGPSANPTQVQYSYTGTGRLATYADSGAGVSASYVYDAAGQRTYAGASTAFGDSSFGITYRYEGTTLLSLSGADSDGNSWRIDYLYDEEGNPYGGVYRDPSTSTSPVYFSMATTDRGDVVELLDASGVPFASYRYDAWGKPTASSYTPTSLIGSTTASNIESRQVLRYGGYAYDWWSGLYYCSARYYDPVTRQWISKDPANADEEESGYQYCSGTPVQNTDPSGEKMSSKQASRIAKRLEKEHRAAGKWGFKWYYVGCVKFPKKAVVSLANGTLRAHYISLIAGFVGLSKAYKLAAAQVVREIWNVDPDSTPSAGGASYVLKDVHAYGYSIIDGYTYGFKGNLAWAKLTVGGYPGKDTTLIRWCLFLPPPSGPVY